VGVAGAGMGVGVATAGTATRHPESATAAIIKPKTTDFRIFGPSFNSAPTFSRGEWPFVPPRLGARTTP